MRRVFPILLVVVGLTVMPVGVCEAGERKHTVAAGESASAIAKTYYGDFGLTPLLLAYNGRAKPDLQPGEVLRVPYCEVHRVKRGDSWSALSHRYLKGKSNYAVVAELNGMLPEKPLQPGDEIVFPVFLDHRLERGETLGALAELYYGQPSLGRLLQESNVLDNPRRLSVGETVQIPLLDFKLTAPVKKAKKIETAQVKKPEPKQKKPAPKPLPEKPAEPPVRFAGELRSARELFQAGEYEKSRNVLESISEDVGSRSPAAEQAEHAGLLAFVYVAFDLSAEACEVYGSIADLPPARELDPDMVSPRIRETLSGCSSN